MKYFTPCPVCYDIGGGGVVERLIFEKNRTIIYSCDKCQSSWREGVDILISNYITLSQIILNQGFSLEDEKYIKQCFEDSTFNISGEKLTELIYQALYNPNKQSLPSPSHLSIWMTNMGKVVGKNGEDHIIIVVNTSGVAVLDACATFEP
jgi:hypothetical protein